MVKKYSTNSRKTQCLIWSTKSVLKVCYNNNNGMFEHDVYNSYDVAHDWMNENEKKSKEREFMFQMKLKT